MAKPKKPAYVLTEYCVYTIKHSDALKEAKRAGGDTFVEQKIWRKAEELGGVL
jgi:hypothetical protein